MTTTKSRLIAYLKENLGRWISGESISAQLGISRAAIWKHIHKLKDDGHLIQAAPRKGYRLEKTADLLLPDEISDGLATRTIGRPSIVVFKQTDSTNLQAKILAIQGAAEGTVVASETQTQGRGRRGRDWFSPPGRNLYISIVLRPLMAPAQAPQVTLMTAVAVARTLQNAGLNARIKWPNDILVDAKKIAGILTEVSTDMDMVHWVVVGLGLNVNTPADQMPAGIREIATSVQIQKGRPVSRTELLCDLLNHFEACYEQLKIEGFTPIMAQWRSLTDVIGQRVYVDVMDTRHYGTVAAVDDEGVLVLKDDHGQIHRLFSGDVTRVRSDG